MDIIHQSFVEVVQESISQSPKDSILPLKKGYLTKISMLENGKVSKDVFLLFDKAFLRIFCAQLIDELNPSKDALEDMAKELANLVVGHAKVIAAKKQKKFNISVPTYVGYKLLKDYDSGLHFKLKRGHCGIYMRSVK